MKRWNILISTALFSISILSSGTGHAANAFNQLVLQKSELERQFGVQRLECFPFTNNIGLMADQVIRVGNCLAGAATLNQAFKEVPNAGIQTIGIDSETYRTSGFDTAIIAWNISKDELVRFLRDRASNEEQSLFREKILALKQKIGHRLGEKDFYCSQRISNSQCLAGYQTLAETLAQSPQSNTRWSKVVLGKSGWRDEDPHTLTLNHDSSLAEMAQGLFNTDPEKNWAPRKRTYDAIEEKYGESFHRKLQLPNFFCDPDLTPEECMKGATNLYVAGLDDRLRDKLWGEVLVNKYNTWITSDFDAHIRYDLKPQKIVEYFSEKPSKASAQTNSVLAETLETKVKGNPSGLRAVCDLKNLLTEHCVNGFKAFMEFVKSHRNYRADRPWTELMFVDGRQLSRVNFALNSTVRGSYIYMDANSTTEELASHLINFGKNSGADR